MPYYGYYYGFDWTYLVLVLPCLLVALWASHNVKATYRRYSKQLSARRITAEQAAQRVLSSAGVYGVRFEHISGSLTDHYDPKTNVIRLSDDVYGSTSTAAIGVACHEAGHAVQYAQSYAPIKLRAAIIPVTNIGSKLAMPLILLGVLFSSFGSFSYTLIYVGVACFSLSLIFQLVTLPVEFNASRRALRAIEDGDLLTQEELKGARKTLRAAALTYVAATAVALAQLLRLLMLFGGRGRNRRN
ncbi:MAG: zinc metallopeptidase [Firmicutes bacterium]|nr:zinc metallopeptidase [Bacillota bacterium]